MSSFSFHRLFILLTLGFCARRHSLRSSTNIYDNECFNDVTSSLIPAKVFTIAWRPGSRTQFKRRNWYGVTAGGRRNYRSGLVVKTRLDHNQRCFIKQMCTRPLQTDKWELWALVIVAPTTRQCADSNTITKVWWKWTGLYSWEAAWKLFS